MSTPVVSNLTKPSAATNLPGNTLQGGQAANKLLNGTRRARKHE